MDNHAARAIRRLRTRIPLYGRRLRLKGAKALIGTDVPESVNPLVKALNDRSKKVRRQAKVTLQHLRGKAKDNFCTLWAQGRDQLLESIIISCRYVASEPRQLNYLTSLKLGHVTNAAHADVDGVDILLTLRADADKDVVKNSDKALIALQNRTAIDYLCSIWSQGRETALEKLILSPAYLDNLWTISLKHPCEGVLDFLRMKNWWPQKKDEQALFYFLSRNMAAYHDCDYNHAILRKWYKSGSQKLKEIIATRIHTSAEVRLKEVFLNKPNNEKKNLDSKEVEFQIQLLIKNGHHRALFSLLPYTIFDQGAKIIRHLKQIGWYHPDVRGRELQKSLEGLVRARTNIRSVIPKTFAHALYQDFRPMLFGKEKLPNDPFELLSWANHGSNYRRRSAAVVALAESSDARLSEVANFACADPYWQVRMAAAAAELLQPGVLSTENKFRLENDHTYWVRALLSLTCVGRLADLDNTALQQLKLRGTGLVCRVDQQDADDFFTIIRGYLQTSQCDYLFIMSSFTGSGVMDNETPQSDQYDMVMEHHG